MTQFQPTGLSNCRALHGLILSSEEAISCVNVLFENTLVILDQTMIYNDMDNTLSRVFLSWLPCNYIVCRFPNFALVNQTTLTISALPRLYL